MAIRTTHAGGQYCDVSSDGAKWCVLHPARYQDHPDGSFTLLDAGRIETHLGDIALPAGELSTRGQGPLYLRCTEVGGGGFQIAGKPHQQSGFVWLWQQATGLWTQPAPDSYGISGHIFDLAGTLHMHPGGAGVSSQGYRYVTDGGVLIEGDATMADLSRDLHEYSEYTIGGVRVAIGQGGSGGTYAVTGVPGVSTLRRFALETGFNWFIRFKHSATTLAVAIWDRDRDQAIIETLDLTDLVAGAPPVQGGGGAPADCAGH